MEENTQQVASTKAEDVVADLPDYILTKTGVMIVGSELVGDKLTALLCEAIKMNESSGLASVVFRNDNFPWDGENPVFAMTYADTHSFAINLEHCWNRAMAIAEEGEKNLSFLGILWVNLLSSIGHELDHVDLAHGDRELYETMRSDEEGNKDLETAAKETAQRLILRLALKYDVEIPAISELGIFATKWMALHTDEDTKDIEWVVQARKMAEEGIVYQEEENDITINTFREFVKQGYDPKDKEDWEQMTTAVNLTAELETGELVVAQAEPVELPQIDEAAVSAEVAEANAEEDEAPVEAVEVPGQVMAAAGTFLGDSPAVETAPAELAVELPAPVQAVADHTAAAAGTGTPPPAYSEPTYPAESLSNENKAAVMKAVWQTVYHHIFTKCGWSQNPTTGRFFFANAAAVLEGVNIQHILTQFGADNFIKEYDTLDANGKPAAEACQGMVRGYLTSKQGLPAYSIYINMGGQRFKRSFLPQNPEKITNNAYTKSADDAAAGNMISWVFKDEVADNAPFKEKCAVKIRNNEYEVM